MIELKNGETQEIFIIFLYFNISYDIMFKVHFKKGMKEIQFVNW